jgi:Na+/glutamate symporter
MNLKYATLGLISGYLAGYVLDYLQTKNTATFNTASDNNFDTTLSDEEETN